jgi:hypothetical protein
MEKFIKIQDKNLFLLNAELLGLPEAQLWIGRPDGPADDDDQKVAERRRDDKKINSILGIEAVDLKVSENFPGWFEVDTSSWPAGIYRFNIHSRMNVQAPNGTELQDMRDLEYSWPKFSDEYLLRLPEEQKEFLYLEKNKRGFCMRIEKTTDGELKPAGDGKEWIANWPEIKKETIKHMQEKIIQTKNPKGIVGIISLLIVVVLAALWMAYLMRHNWFGAPSITGNPGEKTELKNVPVQLDDLRANMKNITDQKDKEINDALK